MEWAASKDKTYVRIGKVSIHNLELLMLNYCNPLVPLQTATSWPGPKEKGVGGRGVHTSVCAWLLAVC